MAFNKYTLSLLLACCMIFASPLMAGNGNGYQGGKHSILTNRLIGKVKLAGEKISSILSDKNKFVLYAHKEDVYSGAALLVNEEISDKDLLSLGVEINSRIGNIWIVQLPVRKIEQVLAMDGIDYMEIDQQAKLNLDKVYEATNANKLSLLDPTKYKSTGKGVVVGIIDGGFDFTIPDFEERIRRTWLQNTYSPTPPANFTYGHEIQFNHSPNAPVYFDNTSGSHGSHVAGIAAGSGALSNGKYKGIAPQSTLVLVSQVVSGENIRNTSITRIVDAIKYIFWAADLDRKTAVVNMSLGSIFGPHDGTSLFVQAVERMVGPGKIVVVSAGNDAGKKAHTHYNFDKDHENALIVPQIFTSKTAIVDIWTTGKSPIKMAPGYYDIDTKEIFFGDYISYNIDSLANNSSFLRSKSNQHLYTVHFDAGQSKFNGKQRAICEFSKVSRSNTIPIISVISDHGSELDAWHTGSLESQSGNFRNIDLENLKSTRADSSYTISGFGGNSPKIITVGAFTSRKNYKNMDGGTYPPFMAENVGDIAGFSSIGPTIANVIKPDIVAPGHTVVSHINSFDRSMRPQQSKTNCKVYEFRNHCMMGMSGTSMSAPVVTGAIALLLENVPSLAPHHVLQILKESAINDKQTGEVRDFKSNTWGWGKLDIKKAIEMSKIVYDKMESKADIRIFPNPCTAADNCTLVVKQILKNNANITIYDHYGHAVKHMTTITQSTAINTTDLAIGVYTLKIKNNSIDEMIRFVVMR